MWSEVPRWVYPVAGGVIVAALITWALLVWRERRRWRQMDETISSVAYDMLKNVLISNGMDEQIHIHYLLLTERGLLVIDLLERPGAIFGGDQMVEWTAIGKKGRYTFRNPQHVLYDRMAALKLLAGGTPVDGRVVFTKRSEFPKGKSSFAMRVDELAGAYATVDRNRGNVVAAFADVWQHVKKHAQPQTAGDVGRTRGAP
jgi:hypothetical protein